MRSEGCLAAGYDQPKLLKRKGYPKWISLKLRKERLREEAGRRAIVLVSIVDPVRVELDLAVVEVEVRSVREVAILVRLDCLHPSESPDLEVYFPLETGLYPLDLEFNLAASKKESAPGKDKQYLFKTTHSQKP